jgi:hypothetical protein
MIELLKGLIGAELTLLGVPNQALPQSVSSELARRLPITEPHTDVSVQPADSSPSEASQAQFHESHYRIAAG